MDYILNNTHKIHYYFCCIILCDWERRLGRKWD